MSDRVKSSKKRRRGSQCSSSTAEYYVEGPPRTSGHAHHAGKVRNRTYFGDVNFDFRHETNFSEAPDSLAHLEETKMTKQSAFADRIRQIGERSRKLHKKSQQPIDKKTKKGMYKEEPLDIARREQGGSCIDLYDPHFERLDDDYCHHGKALQQRPHSVPDKSTKQAGIIIDNYKIPKKHSPKTFGYEKIGWQAKVLNDQKTQDEKVKTSNNFYLSKDSTVADTKLSSLQPSAIDLCSDGETDPEDDKGGINGIQSKKCKDAFPRHYNSSDDSVTSQNATLTDKAKIEQNIAQTIAAIKSDQPFIQGLTLSKAPSSSEGRKIRDVPDLSDQTADEIREKPMSPVMKIVKSFFKGKSKSPNVGQPIVPGASLKSNDLRLPSGASLQSEEKSTTSCASLSTPSKQYNLSTDSSDNSYNKPLQSSQGETSATKFTSPTFEKGDASRSNSCLKYKSDEEGVHTSSYVRRSIRRRTWSGSLGTMKRQMPEVVDMLEDSDDEQNTMACFDIARVALGSSVKHQNCQVKVFNDGIMSFSYSVRSKDKVHNIDFKSGEVEEVYYYIDNTIDIACQLSSGDADIEPGSFVALKVLKTKSNGFSSVISYVPEDRSDGRGFIIAEFRSEADIATFMRVVEEDKHLSSFFSRKNRLTCQNIDLYSKALVADAKREALSRNKRVKASKRIGFLAGKANDYLLLRFPFEGDVNLINAAARGLTELQGSTCCFDSDGEETECEVCMGISLENRAFEGNGDSRRRHHVEIRVEDFERLEPGVYLNDTLIDFFLQWMIRKTKSSYLHVFTTHFYTTLEDKGVDGVSSWTTKKKMDIFKLKFIYIPINKSLHWSFCVVVNPGFILSHREHNPGCDGDAPMPCLLFFDSLKVHQKDRVQMNVIKWLNAEWMRLEKSFDIKAPFDRSSLPVITPKVTYQKNSWDCGVFVCRYAFGMFQLRDRVFSYNEVLGGQGDVIEMITHGDEFNFNLDDIARIRKEMKILIERLSAIYLPWRTKKDQEELLKKLTENKANGELNDSQECSIEASSLIPPRDLPRNTLGSQYSVREFDNRTAKENVDVVSKSFHNSGKTNTSKQLGQQWIEDSASSWRSASEEFRPSLSNDNSPKLLDSASV